MIDSHPRTKLAVAVLDGPRVDFGELDDRSARLAQFLRRRGLHPGDRVAALLENSTTYAIVVWAARRSGLRLVPLNWQLTSGEIRYVIEDCDARAIIASESLVATAASALENLSEPSVRLCDGTSAGAFVALDTAIAGEPTAQLPNQLDGPVMYYSSGTTGKPKGIMRPLGPLRYGEQRPIEAFYASLFGLGPDTRLLLPAPLYFAAPLGWMSATLALGGSVAILRRFDAEHVLRAIETQRITHGLFVPTHLVRLLRLPEETRSRFDLSSLKLAIHAGAPCPPELKQAMIDWWGPRISEYYSGSEGAGFVSASAEEWLARPGTVGRSKGSRIHILDDSGKECPHGQIGTVYFENAPRFEYHKAPEKTAAYFTPEGWGSLGDMGWLDTDGYLFLADRKIDLIISGGANIYPQEIEAVLLGHPAVYDAAVIGIPNPEFGEEAKAIIQPESNSTPDAALAAEILTFCRARLASFKCPKTIEFVPTLPRHANGKLLKRELRARYIGVFPV